MFVLTFSPVAPKTPSPVTISAVPPSLSLFLLRSILQTTFMCCNSWRLLIGGDEFVIERGVTEGSLRVFELYERVRVLSQRLTADNYICFMCGHV